MFKFIGKLFATAKNVLYDLLTEKQNGDARKVSIGRLAFIVVLVAAIHIWVTSGIPVADIPPNMFLTLAALLGYVLGTKAIGSWNALGALKVTNGNGTELKHAEAKKQVVIGDEGD